MKRMLLVFVAMASVAIVLIPSSSALAAGECEPDPPTFGLCGLRVAFADAEENPAVQAGSHPFAFTTDISLNTEKVFGPDGEETIPTGEVKDLQIQAPPGLVGTPTPGPRCPAEDFIVGGAQGSKTNCPTASAVGIATVEFETPGHTLTVPIFNLVPAPGVAAKLGFVVANVAPVTIDIGINPNPPYNVIARVANITQVKHVYGSSATLWGVPADSRHDGERGKCVIDHGTCGVSGSTPVVPFLTLPTRCGAPLETTFEADSWQDPQVPYPFRQTVATEEQSSGCGKLDFVPTISSKPTTDQAGSPSGLDFHVDVDDPGLTNPTGLAASQIKKAVVTLPQGVTVNPSIAEGLAVCSRAQYEAEALGQAPGQGCPQASKIGTIEVETPLLEGTLLKGSVFVAQQDDPATAQPGAENPFDSLLAIYFTIEEPTIGAFVKLAGKITPDPQTGQLVTTVEGIPQFPFSHFRFHFREGGRSPLITPSGCGQFTTTALLTPWADPSGQLEKTSTFAITRGAGGSPCPPAGAPPFDPGFSAGTLSNQAGSYSPTVLRLTRRDGDRDLTKLSFDLPPGLLAKLAGVGKCTDAQIAAAKAKTGRAELSSPSCPASSEIGSVIGGAGVGSQLTYVPGKVYLAAPYNGAPLSTVAIIPAVAGPFDVGTVVVRQALDVDPKTAKARIDGARSDPVPHMLAGIPLSVRDVRVSVDRPQFTLNPTDCDPFDFGALLWGEASPVSRTARFQAANCASLPFAPRLSFKLKGGTRRGAHPALTVEFRPRPGEANTEHVVVRLPHSAFLDQAHIRTICTRVQFAADACPPGAIYGYVKAFTPLLDEPLQGPVYLRSSDHNLPDLIFDLHGLVDVEIANRLDSFHGGIRATIEDAPDAPLTKLVLSMQGAKKGLIVNSRNLCAQRSLANVQLIGHNGRRYDSSPPVQPSGCGQAPQARRR